MPPRPSTPLGAGPLLLLVLLSCTLQACGLSRSYEVRGRIVGFGDDARTVIVEHADVPGLMPAMTMPFRSTEPEAVARLQTGDAVAFTLHVSRDSTWITGLTPLPDDAVPRHPAGATPAVPDGGEGAPFLDVGDPVPAYTLVTQDGDTLSTSQLAGKAWLVTFVYTRCPLPEYCPLLSQKFRMLQAPLRAQFGDRVHLLSVSFDPAYDTPDVLHAYARRYDADPALWTFATGEEATIRRLAEQMGVFYQAGTDDFTHNLTTTLVGPDGRVAARWTGNEWTTDAADAAVARVLGGDAPQPLTP